MVVMMMVVLILVITTDIIINTNVNIVAAIFATVDAIVTVTNCCCRDLMMGDLIIGQYVHIIR